jgi:hypothetical protein
MLGMVWISRLSFERKAKAFSSVLSPVQRSGAASQCGCPALGVYRWLMVVTRASFLGDILDEVERGEG